MSKINVLVFPAGEINSIELHDSLSTCVNVEVFGASSIDRHGEYVFRNYTSGLPMINADNFCEEFNNYIQENNISLIFPTHDTVAVFLTENQSKIKAKVIAADKETSAILRDKEKTYNTFKDETFTPRTYKEIATFPVFIKPKISQGAVGTKLIQLQEDIPNVDLSNYVICEYLPGEEYTVDCLTDKNGDLKIISPRSRQRLLAGVCVAGKTEVLSREIEEIAHIINNKLSFMGLWWFQIKKDKNENFKLLEISTRCAGTMCLTRAKGFNLPLLSVYVAMGFDISTAPNNIPITVDRTLISRYKLDYEYHTVYFDFDDTLIINNKVHLPAIWFLHQCKNKGIKVILITKHEDDLYEALDQFAIHKSLFDEIIWLNGQQQKIDYIKPEKAIFIDNMYKERKAVAEKYGMPVFDVEAIEILFDWRN